MTGRIWLRIILPLLLVGTCGAAMVLPCGMFGPPAKCRSRQSEARSNLKSLFVSQEAFRGEHDRYGRSLADIDFAPQGTVRRYHYVIERADDVSFSALAIALTPESLAGDVWRIDQDNSLTNLVNACR